MAARKRTVEELREQSKHVLYEIQMLAALGGYIRTGEVDRAVRGLAYLGIPARNAIIEAFELHARNLIEFLIHQPGAGAATAGDFTRGRWEKPTNWRDLKALRTTFSERVGHLNWKRSEFTDDEQLVAAAEIFDAIVVHLGVFFEQADPDLLDEHWIDSARFALDPVSLKVTRPMPWQQPSTGAFTGGTATQGIGPSVENDQNRRG